MSILFSDVIHNVYIELKRFPLFTKEMCFIVKRWLTGRLIVDSSQQMQRPTAILCQQ